MAGGGSRTPRWLAWAALLLLAVLQSVSGFSDTWHEERRLERALLCCAAGLLRKAWAHASPSIHYDVLKTSTLEMYPTDKCCTPHPRAQLAF